MHDVGNKYHLEAISHLTNDKDMGLPIKVGGRRYPVQGVIVSLTGPQGPQAPMWMFKSSTNTNSLAGAIHPSGPLLHGSTSKGILHSAKV